MKSTITNFLTFKPVLICLILAGLYFITPGQAQAQSGAVSYSFFAVPDGPYVAPPEAMSRLEDQIVPLKNQLSFYNPSSQEYKIAFAKYSFFDRINQAIVEGKTVKAAIQDGVNDLGSSEMSTSLPKGKKEEFKQEVIDLLKL